MDNTSNRAHEPSAPNQNPRFAHVERAHQKKKFSIEKVVKVATVLLFAVIITIGCLYLFKSTTSSKIDSSKYQAVFLTNGQVYFGKLKIQNSGYMVLSNIYYLQTKTNDSTTGDIQAAAGEDDSNVELVKLGSEIHGPLDEMIINTDQVLFFENLKDDGKLTQTIIKFEAEN